MKDIINTFDKRFDFIKRVYDVDIEGKFKYEEFMYHMTYLNRCNQFAFVPITCEDEVLKDGYIFKVFMVLNAIYTEAFDSFPHHDQDKFILPDIKHYIYIPVIRSENIKDDMQRKSIFYSTILMILKMIDFGVGSGDNDDTKTIQIISSLTITSAYFKEYDMGNLVQIVEMNKNSRGYSIYISSKAGFLTYYARNNIFHKFFSFSISNDDLDEIQDIFSEIASLTIVSKLSFISDNDLFKGFGEYLTEIFTKDLND